VSEVDEEICCGVCGRTFPNEEAYEAHTFKVGPFRFCIYKLKERIDEQIEKLVEKLGGRGAKTLIVLGKLKIRVYGTELVFEKSIDVWRVPEGAYVSIYSSDGKLHREIMIKEHTLITDQGEVIEAPDLREIVDLVIKHLKVGK